MPHKSFFSPILDHSLHRTAPEGAHYLASDLSSALHLLDSSELEKQVDQVWIIGGSALYKVGKVTQFTISIEKLKENVIKDKHKLNMHQIPYNSY